MKKCKIRSQGVAKESCDLLFEFWDFLHISKKLKLETSNLALILITKGNNEWYCGWQCTSAVMLTWMVRKAVLVVGRQALEPVVLHYLWQLRPSHLYVKTNFFLPIYWLTFKLSVNFPMLWELSSHGTFDLFQHSWSAYNLIVKKS